MNGPPRTLTSAEEMRMLGGLVAQPFLAAALAFVTFPVLLLRDGQTLAGGYPSDRLDAALSVAVGAGIVAGVVTLIGVWPSAVWLIKRRQLTLTQTLGLGLLFGNLPYALMAAAARGTYGSAGMLRGVVFASLLGVSGAALFWFLAVRSKKETW